MSRGKRLLVTGGAGFIGSHTADRLVAAGYEVAVLDNLSTGRVENVPPAARFFPHDINSREAAELIRSWQPRALLHFAAQVSVSCSVRDPLGDARENILGSLNLLTAAAQAGVEKVVFASTGGAMYGDEAPAPARETDPATPESPYAIAKLAVEHYLRFFGRQHRMTPVSLRYANVYGPRQSGQGEAGVVAIFTEKFLAGEQPVIHGDGRQTRDFLYVTDAVAAALLALDYPGAGVFNIGTGQETDILTIGRRLKELTGARQDAAHGPPKAGEQRRSALDSSRAAAALGWQPQVDLEEGLRRTVAAFREQRAAMP